MKLSSKTIEIDEKVEFDIILGGKYQKRVENGILIEKDGDEIYTYVGCDCHALFETLLCLTMFVTQNGLDEDFNKFLKKRME